MASGSLSATPLQRQFLRAVAAVNPSFHPGRDDPGAWWSPMDLQSTMLFPDFRETSTMSLAARGRSCEASGFVRTRRIGTRGHGWTEWRVTGLGRGLVADSCIGGGLRWNPADDPAVCPACRSTAAELGLTEPLTEPVPVHPLPGYLPVTTTPGGN